ncbi:hypothetical protein NKW56_13240 [Acetobacter cerevisiae]|nr:hypothetical protein [Acetobacter cerevisiae]MCP1271567.1 hypothetical protein [Acetobacter cerevisiae]MCP1279508.1 hypothetical protein [Acetobacter cerevisiae]
MSALGNAVLHVLLLVSQGHVIDIAARRSVTQMKDEERLSCSLVGGNGAMFSFPCKAMGTFRFAVVINLSMSAMELGALINQTGALQESRAWLGFQFAVQSVCD